MNLAPPAVLKGLALEEWQELGPVYVTSGVLTVGDRTFFETYCRIVGDEDRYTRLVARLGDEAAHQLGYDSHLLKIRGQLNQYFSELGGTPSSRSGVKAKKPADSDDERRRRFFGIHRQRPPGAGEGRPSTHPEIVPVATSESARAPLVN
jgi:phage terminase small subunit